jgi:hypothetical protein
MSANVALPASGKGDPNGMRIAEITAKRAGASRFSWEHQICSG